VFLFIIIFVQVFLRKTTIKCPSLHPLLIIRLSATVGDCNVTFFMSFYTYGVSNIHTSDMEYYSSFHFIFTSLI
jgi:hypothetical protein